MKKRYILAAVPLCCLLVAYTTLKPTNTPTQRHTDVANHTHPPRTVHSSDVHTQQRLHHELSQHHATRATQHKQTDNIHDAPYSPHTDYTYSSPALREAIKGLEHINALRKRHANITEDDILAVWQKVDTATQENTITPIEAIKHKQWLASLVTSPRINHMLTMETTELTKTLKADAEKARQASANDPQFLTYKAEEARITKDILAKYPNDKVKAAQELEKALDALRVKVYTPD